VAPLLVQSNGRRGSFFHLGNEQAFDGAVLDVIFTANSPSMIADFWPREIFSSFATGYGKTPWRKVINASRAVKSPSIKIAYCCSAANAHRTEKL